MQVDQIWSDGSLLIGADRTGRLSIKGNTAPNGGRPITVTDAIHFTLDGSSGNGNYVGGTGTCKSRGDGLLRRPHSAGRADGAQQIAGRILHQDDDPTINGLADASCLASLIKSHFDSIRTTVLAAYTGEKFELLWPYDVNFATCHYTRDIPAGWWPDVIHPPFRDRSSADGDPRPNHGG